MRQAITGNYKINWNGRRNRPPGSWVDTWSPMEVVFAGSDNLSQHSAGASVSSSTSSGVSTGDAAVTTYTWSGSNSLTNDRHLSRAVHFAAVYEAIKKMSALPSFHDLHLEPAAANKALDVLSVIAENWQIEPPKLLNQDGEAVVLTWSDGDFKRYLTIDEDEADVMDLDRKRGVKFIHNLNLHEIESFYAKLAETIGARPSSSSVDG